jgi:hypothetical protein
MLGPGPGPIFAFPLRTVPGTVENQRRRKIMRKYRLAATLIALLMAGCGAESGETAEAPAENPETAAAPETAVLSAEIVLPDGWEISDAISARR